MKLDNRICVITGGSSGIGLAIAELFAEQGGQVVIASVDSKEALEASAVKVSSRGRHASAVSLDVSDSNAVEAAIGAIGKEFGRIDVLVNSAGVWSPNPLPDANPSVFLRMLAVNLAGTYFCINACIPFMLGKGGSVVNVTSLAGILGLAGSSGYSASKGGAVLLTKTLATELAPRRIRVNGIAPGNVETPINAEVRRPENHAILERYRQITPSGRVYSQPQDIANIALFLASDDAAALYGTIVVADEGLSASLPNLS